MKTLAASLMLIVVAACSVADFDVTRQISQKTIPGTGSSPPATPDAAQTIDIPLQQTVDSSSTGIVNSIYLSDLHFDITSTGDWGFVQSMTIYIASTMSGSTLPKTVAATASSPGDVTRLDFKPAPGLNLVPYVNEGAVLTATATGTPPTQDVTFDGALTLHVHPL